LSAEKCGSWLTLNELAEMTCYARASISPQLRHLRKHKYGGYKIEKRRRESEESKLVSTHERVYEYQLKRSERVITDFLSAAVAADRQLTEPIALSAISE
jgi:DNA-binding transcriptional regulator GbsR (MarR family)